MPSSPLQFVNAQTQPHPPIARTPYAAAASAGADRCRPWRACAGQCACCSGKRRANPFERFPAGSSSWPRFIFSGIAHASTTPPLQPPDASRSRSALLRGIGPSFCLPPVKSSRGTIPIQAAKSRPDGKTFGSGTVAAIAVAPITPIPGMLSSRWLASFTRCCAMIRFSIDPINVCVRLKLRRQHDEARVRHRPASVHPLRSQ